MIMQHDIINSISFVMEVGHIILSHFIEC
jgi:hypothetical protein